MKRFQIMGGTTAGKRNKESGHMSALGKKWGVINAKRLHQEHPEIFQAIGRRNAQSGRLQAQGFKNKESGWAFKLGKSRGRTPANLEHLAKLRTPEHQSAAGKVIGRQNVESGHIFNIPRAKITYGRCGIVGHKHRSNPEIKLCGELQTQYPNHMIHSCVRFRRKEIDFVITDDVSDASGWLKVIEPHNSYWDQFKDVDYDSERRNLLISLGVTCPIEIIVK